MTFIGPVLWGRYKLVSSTVEKIFIILWATLQSHYVMADFYKHEIKYQPSITSIFVRFLVTANISEPLQNIFQMNTDIKVLITKLYCHHGRLTNIE